MMEEKWKVRSVMMVMRSLPEERAEAREVLKLVNELVNMHGYEMPGAQKPAAPKRSRPKRPKRK